MDDQIEFQNVFREERGAFSACRLTFRPDKIIFKNIKTGMITPVRADEISSICWQRFAKNFGIRLLLKGGQLHRFDGLKPQDKEKLQPYVERHYHIDLQNKEMSLKGFNWGSTEFDGEALSFNIDNNAAFEIPLTAVSDCSSSKNDIILSFHHNDDAAVGMTDMRLHMPPGCGEEAIKAFVESVLSKASVIKITGQSIATFTDLQCLTPRGRYEFKLFPSFIQLHGGTHNHKIPISTVLRLFQLPHKDGRQAFFLLALDPPIVSGQTRYQFLQILFQLDTEIDVDLDMSEDELKTKYEGRLTKHMSGPFIDVFANVMRAITGKRVNLPEYKNPTNSAISCSYKSNNGLLYPLERGFVYVHRPAMHIRFEEISTVNFARSDGSTRSFDLEIETKAGTTHTFISIEKEEYGRLYDYVTRKKLRIRNQKSSVSTTNIIDELAGSDDDDAYLAHVKNEGRTREAGDEDDSEEEDEDFDPDAAGSDSSAGGSGSESGDGSDSEDFESEDISSDEDSKKRKKKEAAKKTPAKESVKKEPAKKAKTSASTSSTQKSKPKVDMDESSAQGRYKSREFIDDDDDSSD